MCSAKSDSHRPIWESSRRPLHPKCVWIESIGASGGLNGGHRHFIFDYNLSNARNEAPSSLNGPFHPGFALEKTHSLDAMANKFGALSIIGSSDRMQSNRAFSSFDDDSSSLEFLIDKNVFEPLNLPDEGVSIESMEIRKETPSTPSMKRITNEIDSNKNLLAERVLQWLDLAGGQRGQSSARRSEHIGKLLNASKRRSVTAKEPRKSMDFDDDGPKPKPIRREPIRQLSMTFNDEQPTKDIQSLNQAIVSLSFIDLFPATYKCSRKFLSLRRPKSISDRLEPLDLQSTVPLKSAKKSTQRHSNKMKPKRLEYFDDQYRSIIQRQILETSCNTQAAKRQLHIFMPNLPKRCLIVNDGDAMSTLISPTSARDNDSCLSCKFAST